MRNNKIKLFREYDYKSRLLNIDKYEWIKELLEARYKENISVNKINSILNTFNTAVDKFYTSNIGIHNVNEQDTIAYFIEPFLYCVLPDMYKTNEFRLPEQNIRLDSVIYDSSKYVDGEIVDDDSNFVFLEYKKAGIFSKSYSDDVYVVAKEHGLLQKQSSKSDADKYVLKGLQSRQMVQYLDATKSVWRGNCKDCINTSAGIITNGLSYYFMICDGNDAKASNQTWSILYKLDIAELAYSMNIEEAQTAIGTFLGLINTFMSNSKRADFFRWYHNQYNKISNSIKNINTTKDDYDAYVEKILKNRKTANGILTTYNNYKKSLGI